MTTEKVYRRGSEEGSGIIELAGGALEIESFTSSSTRYKVHPDSGYCTCPRYQHTGRCVKHPIFGEAIQRVRERSLRSVFFGKAYTKRTEEELFDLCKRIFAKLDRNEHPIDSYELFLEVVAYRHSTDRMIKCAAKRHGRVLAMYGQRDYVGAA